MRSETLTANFRASVMTRVTQSLCIALAGSVGCTTTRQQKDCSIPSDCAPFHHTGGTVPAPNIMKPLDKAQNVRRFPSQ